MWLEFFSRQGALARRRTQASSPPLPVAVHNAGLPADLINYPDATQLLFRSRVEIHTLRGRLRNIVPGSTCSSLEYSVRKKCSLPGFQQNADSSRYLAGSNSTQRLVFPGQMLQPVLPCVHTGLAQKAASSNLSRSATTLLQDTLL